MLFGQGTGHDTRYSLPTASELAALIARELTTDVCRFDVVVQTKMGYLEQISPLNPSLMSLQYPLLFSYGDRGLRFVTCCIPALQAVDDAWCLTTKMDGHMSSVWTA